MHLLQLYCECLKAGDVKKLASLFTEDAIFDDDGPTKFGQKPIFLKDRDNIEAFFKILLAKGGLKISNIGINGNAMRYDLKFGDTVVLALGVMKEKDNLIKEYKITVI